MQFFSYILEAYRNFPLFIEKYRGTDRMPYLWMLIWFLGSLSMTKHIVTRVSVDFSGPLSIAILIVISGLFIGVALYFLVGFLFYLAILVARGKASIVAARNSYIFIALPSALGQTLGFIIAIYFTHGIVSGTAGTLVASAGYFWSTLLAYQAARAFGSQKSISIFMFLIVPIVVHIALYVTVLYLVTKI